MSKQNYELFKAAILAAIDGRHPTYSELLGHITDRLDNHFDGNISWHAMTVKLDLEARGLIERTGSKPERYRLARTLAAPRVG